jgi:hypothetical protein
MAKGHKIVWIASYPKSGNTWVRLFLAAYLANTDQLDPNDALKGTFNDAQRPVFDKLLKLQSKELDDDVVASLRLPYLSKLAESGDKDVIIKTHVLNANWHNAAMIPSTVTRRALYIIRHPFDVCTSFAKHMGLSFDEAVTAMGNPSFAIGSDTQIKQPLHTWSTHVSSWLGATGFERMTIRYEDMILRPYQTFANIINFMGMGVENDKIDRALSSTDFDRLKEVEKKKGFLEASDKNDQGFFRSGKIGGFKGILSAKQTAKLSKDHADMMSRFGYGDDGSVF